MIDDIANVLRYDQRGCGRSEEIGPYNPSSTVRADFASQEISKSLWHSKLKFQWVTIL
jgi:hypothetical protein